MKVTGKRSAGNPHAAFDVAGAGNVIMVAGLRPIAKAMDQPPEPKVRAPVLDPTCERLRGKFLRATRPANIYQQFRHHNINLFFQRYGLNPVNGIESYFTFLS